MQVDSQVIVVGGGPVGMGLAIELGQRGIQITVIESHPTPQPIPKGQNLTQRTMEHMHFWHTAEAIRAERTIPKGRGIGGLTAYGQVLSDYTYDWLQRGLVRPYYFTENERIPQYATEGVLRERAGNIDCVNILYGWDGKKVTPHNGNVEVLIKEHKGNGQKTLRANYVVGCDGSKSIVREQAGITQSRSAHDKLMVLLVFRSRQLDRLLREHYPNKFFFHAMHPDLKGYWLFFGRVDLEQRFFFHAPVPKDTTEDNFDFRDYLQKAAGAKFDVDIEHVGFWDLRFMTANIYQSGRIFIAGDAAHSHPPYGGYGINTGFEDARNLGWKLAATLNGWGQERLLNTYSEERQPVFESTADDFIKKSINADREFLETYDPKKNRREFEMEWHQRGSEAKKEVDAYEPNYSGSSIIYESDDTGPRALGSHSFAARAGHHLAPLELKSGDNIFEELGTGFTLLALDANESTIASFKSAAEKSDLPLKVIRDSRTERLAPYESNFILVRPDHFVAWASSNEPLDPDAILQCVVGG